MASGARGTGHLDLEQDRNGFAHACDRVVAAQGGELQARIHLHDCDSAASVQVRA
jgi:hypothetical protein